jgi:sirohydrochlorin cobaltochelatase
MAVAKDAIVLFAHGAREAAWAEPFRRVQARLRTERPDALVELAFLELMRPTLPEAVERLADAGVERITVVPVFLAQGGHLKEDLPRLLEAIRAKHRQLVINVTSAIGDSEAMINAIAEWVLAQHRKITP